jgi:hypothetical protein
MTETERILDQINSEDLKSERRYFWFLLLTMGACFLLGVLIGSCK